MFKYVVSLFTFFFSFSAFAGTYCISVNEYSSVAKAVRVACFGQSNVENFTIETGSGLWTSAEDNKSNIQAAQAKVQSSLFKQGYLSVGVFEDYEVFQRRTEVVANKKIILLVESAQIFRFFLSGGWEKHALPQDGNKLILDIVNNENVMLDAMYMGLNSNSRDKVKFLSRRVRHHETGFFIYRGIN